MRVDSSVLVSKVLFTVGYNLQSEYAFGLTDSVPYVP